jgi:hypothetical protein
MGLLKHSPSIIVLSSPEKVYISSYLWRPTTLALVHISGDLQPSALYHQITHVNITFPIWKNSPIIIVVVPQQNIQAGGGAWSRPPLVPSIGIKPMFIVVILYLTPYLQAPPPPGREDNDANHILVKIVLAAHIGVGKIMPGESGGEE